jgi:hypothetical protein
MPHDAGRAPGPASVVAIASPGRPQYAVASARARAEPGPGGAMRIGRADGSRTNTDGARHGTVGVGEIRARSGPYCGVMKKNGWFCAVVAAVVGVPCTTRETNVRTSNVVIAQMEWPLSNSTTAWLASSVDAIVASVA